jgi:uncharacterized membrane protein SpoIIM required for sporulation
MFNFNPNPSRPFLDTLFLGAIVVVTMAFGAVVLYYATSGLWLLVHNVIEVRTPLPSPLSH